MVIPVKHQEAVLAELHLNHPGIVRMKALARLHVWWPTLDSDIEQIVRNCEVCQTHGKAPLTSDNCWIWPHRAWQRVHVDYCGPLDGKSFLVIVDAKSKWIEVLPMCVVFSTRGLLEEIVSDNGPQFIAQEFRDFLKCNHIKHFLSAPYHPERAVRTFKQAMKASKLDSGTLAKKICSFLLSYRSTPHPATGCTPAELLMNHRIRTRLDVLLPDLRKKVTKPNKLQPSTPKRQLTVGDPVLVQDYRKNRDPWSKGVIVSKLGPVTYRVQVDSFFWKRHIDQLKDLSATKLPFPRQGESKVVLPQAFSASSSITESIPSSDYTPVTDKPNSKLDTPFLEQGNSLFPTVEESAMQEEPKTLTRRYS